MRVCISRTIPAAIAPNSRASDTRTRHRWAPGVAGPTAAVRADGWSGWTPAPHSGGSSWGRPATSTSCSATRARTRGRAQPHWQAQALLFSIRPAPRTGTRSAARTCPYGSRCWSRTLAACTSMTNSATRPARSPRTPPVGGPRDRHRDGHAGPGRGQDRDGRGRSGMAPGSPRRQPVPSSQASGESPTPSTQGC